MKVKIALRLLWISFLTFFLWRVFHFAAALRAPRSGYTFTVKREEQKITHSTLKFKATFNLCVESERKHSYRAPLSEFKGAHAHTRANATAATSLCAPPPQRMILPRKRFFCAYNFFYDLIIFFCVIYFLFFNFAVWNRLPSSDGMWGCAPIFCT